MGEASSHNLPIYFTEDLGDGGQLRGFLLRHEKSVFVTKGSISPLVVGKSTVVVSPEIHWISDFDTLYENFLREMGSDFLHRIITNFVERTPLPRKKHMVESLIVDLIDLETAKELGYYPWEINAYLFHFRRICERKSVPDSTFYELHRGPRKRKLLYLSLLSSIIYRILGKKIILSLSNAELPTSILTRYLRGAIFDKLISFLELTSGLVSIVIPCSEEIFTEFKRRCRRQKLKVILIP